MTVHNLRSSEWIAKHFVQSRRRFAWPGMGRAEDTGSVENQTRISVTVALGAESERMSRRGINPVPPENPGEKSPVATTVDPDIAKPIRVQNVALTVFATLSAIALLRYAQ